MQAPAEEKRHYEFERRVRHAERPGFRITELQISPTQQVPWHYHNNVQDTFYVLSGAIRVFVANPKEEVHLTPGQTFSVPPGRPHLVVNAGTVSAVFFVLQGIGAYDFQPTAAPSN
jgi:mannose-6-phosphate isomerase-like protein (cupin superfamily)